MKNFTVYLHGDEPTEVSIEAEQFFVAEEGYSFFVYDSELEDSTLVAYFPFEHVWYIIKA